MSEFNLIRDDKNNSKKETLKYLFEDAVKFYRSKYEDDVADSIEEPKIAFTPQDEMIGKYAAAVIASESKQGSINKEVYEKLLEGYKGVAFCIDVLGELFVFMREDVNDFIISHELFAHIPIGYLMRTVERENILYRRNGLELSPMKILSPNFYNQTKTNHEELVKGKHSALSEGYADMIAARITNQKLKFISDDCNCLSAYGANRTYEILGHYTVMDNLVLYNEQKIENEFSSILRYDEHMNEWNYINRLVESFSDKVSEKQMTNQLFNDYYGTLNQSIDKIDPKVLKK